MIFVSSHDVPKSDRRFSAQLSFDSCKSHDLPDEEIIKVVDTSEFFLLFGREQGMSAFHRNSELLRHISCYVCII